MKHANLASGIAGGMLLLGVWLLPSSALAFSAELESISPEPIEDLSDMIGDAPETVAVFAWFNEVGTEYTAVLWQPMRKMANLKNDPLPLSCWSPLLKSEKTDRQLK
jgi:hypothetical protein